MAHKIIWDLLLFGDFKDSHEMLHKLYVEEKWSLERIGDHLGLEKTSVRKELVRLGFEIRPKGRPRFPENEIKLAKQLDGIQYTFATMTITRKAIKL